MRRAATKRRWVSVLAVALLAAIAALAAATPPAAASYRHHYGHYPYRPYCPYCGHRPVYYPPVVIAPAPVVIAPAPVVVAPPPPVIAAPMAPPPVLAPPAVAGPGLPAPLPGSLPQAAAGYPAAPVAPGLEGTPGCLVVREYTTEIQVGGKTVEGYGYACLQADGSWKRGAPAPVP